MMAWQPHGNHMATEVRLGKDSIGKNSIDKDRVGKDIYRKVTTLANDDDIPGLEGY